MVALLILWRLFSYLSVVELVFARGKIIDIFNGEKSDIVQEQESNVLHHGTSKFRNAIYSDSRYKWNVKDRKGNVVIPFVIRGRYDRSELNVIKQAMERIEANTCIRFQTRDHESDYVEIRNKWGEGCYTNVGRHPGRNVLMLESNEESTCLEVHIVQHELLHVIGLWHEHMRHDRDKYIKVHYKNIMPGYEDQFTKVSSFLSTVYNIPYDYKSVMHYTKTAFARKGKISMETLDPSYMDVIGRQKDASTSDYEKVCKIYECAICNRGSTNTTTEKGDHKPSPTTSKPQPTTIEKCSDKSPKFCFVALKLRLLNCNSGFFKRYCCFTCELLSQEEDDYPFEYAYYYYAF